jgi:hypothetical protein
MGQDKLFELLAIQFCRNPLPMLAFHHFQPQKDGDFRGLARPQQKTQKDLSHQRPKDKFNQSEKPATSSRTFRRRWGRRRKAIISRGKGKAVPGGFSGKGRESELAQDSAQGLLFLYVSLAWHPNEAGSGGDCPEQNSRKTYSV